MDTTARVLSNPKEFFSHVPLRDNYLNPLAYYLICATLSLVAGLLLYRFTGLLPGGRHFQPTETRQVGGRLLDLLQELVLETLLLSVGAVLTHVAVRIIVNRESAGLPATFRAVAYPEAAFLFSWLPYVGWVFDLYAFYLAAVGIREIHRTTIWKSVAALLLPLVVLAPVACVIFAAVELSRG